ncbi:MAG TPA: hypothetical protein VF541_02175 [Longimicrobium sp.]
MGFELEAFLGPSADLRGWKRHLPSAVVCELGGELGMVPLTGALYRELAATLGDEAARLDAAQKYRTWPSPGMQEGVRRWAAEASRGTVLAHVSTGEFGDTSYENVTVWEDGAVVRAGGGLAAVLGHFRQRGMDVGSRPIDLEIHRGENAAEKWAAAAMDRARKG